MHAASNVYFGLNPMWVVDLHPGRHLRRHHVGEGQPRHRRAARRAVMIVVGVLDQEEALKGVDWNTIGLLTGMMILVSISRRSGMFQYVAIWSAQAAQAHPAGILFLLQITTAVLSAFLDNVTTVLLIVPVTLAITKELDVPPYPYLFAEIFASNIGGTATLIGDPPNILIGSLVGLDFNDFVIHLTPVIVVVMVVQAIMIHLVWGRDLKATPEREAARHGDEARARRSPTGCCSSNRSSCSRVVMIAFVLARPLHLEPATIAMLRRRGADAARQLGAPQREGGAEHPPDLRRRRMDHDLLLHRPVHRRARRRGRRPAEAPGRPARGRDRRRPGDTPASPSCGRRRCCRPSSTTSPSSPP